MDCGCRLSTACKEINLSVRTYRRWQHKGTVVADRRSTCERKAPANRLSEQEKDAILTVCNAPEYAHLPPSQIVPALLDNGQYLASESTFYRVLNAHNQLNHRGRQRPPAKRSKPTSYTAKAPNQVYTWDITYLPASIKGQYFYLYLIEDIYSRKIVGAEVYEQECGDKAAALLQRTVLKEGCLRQPLVLHSDNGAPMKSQVMKAKIEELGVTGSYSRPRVSNDNPYVESLFHTLKYRPDWPTEGFPSLVAAREWVEQFIHWYNEEHKHSKLNFVTPSERHERKDQAVLQWRAKVLLAARAQWPHRWRGRDIRNCKAVGSVTLNPDFSETENVMKIAA